MLAFFRNDMGFGGNNGFTDFKDILGFDLHADARASRCSSSPPWRWPPATAPAAHRRSRAGRVIRAIRDAESRTRFLGYRVESYKLWLFVFSAVIAGIAGALYVPQVGIINPGEFAPINSIEVVIWVAVGGRGTLYGAAAGAVLVNYAKTLLHRRAPRSLALRARRALRPGDALPAARGLVVPVTARLPAWPVPASGAEAAGVRERGDAGPAARQDLYLEKLTVSFDGFKALNALTLYVDPGELRCIIGPNGAGKTTMMDVITGKTRPDEGTAWFGQQHRSAGAERARNRARRHRPQVPEADRLRAPDGVREPRAGAGRATGRSGRCCVARLTPASASGSTACSTRSGSPTGATCSPARSRTARSSGSRSACC